VEDGPADGGSSAASVGDGGAPRPPRRSRVDPAREAEARDLLRAGRPREAIQVLMKAYGSGVLGYARRMLGDAELAEDTRQQVFLEAWLGLDKFEGRSSLWVWLCGIAYHRCLDAAKRRKRIQAGEVSVDADVLDSVLGTPEGSMAPDQLAQRQALVRCLGKIPAAHRAQLSMRYCEGLSHVEIGQIVGEPPGTVQVRITRLLPKLRRCLKARVEP
jgi:RNA polymerase sigma-70 factor (ECF subfamily)